MQALTPLEPYRIQYEPRYYCGRASALIVRHSFSLSRNSYGFEAEDRSYKLEVSAEAINLYT